MSNFLKGFIQIWSEQFFQGFLCPRRNFGWHIQGGESRDLFRLFRTCIRTGPVRKLFIISLILNEFSCGDVHMSCLCNQQTNIEVFCAYAL